MSVRSFQDGDVVKLTRACRGSKMGIGTIGVLVHECEFRQHPHTGELHFHADTPEEGDDVYLHQNRRVCNNPGAWKLI